MLILRKDQLDAVRQDAFAQLENELVHHLLTNFPGPAAAVGGEPEMRAFVRRGMAEAARHAIDTAGAITVFVELRLQFGERFERSPDRAWAANILAHPRLPGYVKVGAIRDRFAERTGGRVLVSFPTRT